jgi:hypothetical protein
MEFDFLLPEHNSKKLSQKQNNYRNAKEVGDKIRMDSFLCIHPDPPDALEFRPFPEFRIKEDFTGGAEIDLLTEPLVNDAHILYEPQACESNPITPRAKEKAKECEEINDILIKNMDGNGRTWKIVHPVPHTSGTASPLVYFSNIDIESRLKKIDYKASSIDKNRDYSTNIEKYGAISRPETSSLVTGGHREVNNTFNNTSVGFVGGRELFGISTKRKTAFE